MLYPENLKENEYICLFLSKTDENGNEIKFHKYVKNFEEYEKCIDNYKYNYHIYNALATVKKDKNNELHRKKANMRQQRVLFLDFDKKDYPDLNNVFDFTKMIKNKLPNLFLHAYYDSGHGYHYYTIIPHTCKLKEIYELNKEICKLVGADVNACKITQVVRIPCTYNYKSLINPEENNPEKEKKFPIVKEIDHYQNHPNTIKKFHPCNIDYIKLRVNTAKKILESTKALEKWNYNDKGFDLKTFSCFCTEKILKEGAVQGERNIWLGRIISMLLYSNYTEDKIQEICLNWNTKCKPPKNTNIIKKDIDFYLEKKDVYKLNGCWEKIKDQRTSEMVKRQCDKFHCMKTVKKENILIKENDSIKISQKLLTTARLDNKGKTNLSGYEFLIMSVLYKYIIPKSRIPFTVKELKERIEYKKNDKWKLCMDIETFRITLKKLVEHHCIELIEPKSNNKKVILDNMQIKIKPGLKISDDTTEYIEIYYSVVKAFISKQITQNDFKVFLCIINNIKNKVSCTVEDLDKILYMEKSNILKSVNRLQSSQCIDVIQYRSYKGNWHNVYSQIYTNEYNDITYYEPIE